MSTEEATAHVCQWCNASLVRGLHQSDAYAASCLARRGISGMTDNTQAVLVLMERVDQLERDIERIRRGGVE